MVAHQPEPFNISTLSDPEAFDDLDGAPGQSDGEIARLCNRSGDDQNQMQRTKDEKRDLEDVFTFKSKRQRTNESIYDEAAQKIRLRK